MRGHLYPRVPVVLDARCVLAQLVGRESLQQLRIQNEGVFLVREQVPSNRPPAFSYALIPTNLAIGSRVDTSLTVKAWPERSGVTLVWLETCPRFLLACMIVRHCERHQVLKGELAFAVEREKLRPGR